MSFTINGKVFGKYQYIEYHLDADNSVDNAYLTDVYLTLSPDATDRDIIRALKQAGLLKAGLHYDKFAIGGELGGTLYPCHATHGPVCELRRVIDDCTRCHVERYYEHDMYAEESMCTDCEHEIACEYMDEEDREGAL